VMFLIVLLVGLTSGQKPFGLGIGPAYIEGNDLGFKIYGWYINYMGMTNQISEQDYMNYRRYYNGNTCLGSCPRGSSCKKGICVCDQSQSMTQVYGQCFSNPSWAGDKEKYRKPTPPPRPEWCFREKRNGGRELDPRYKAREECQEIIYPNHFDDNTQFCSPGDHSFCLHKDINMFCSQNTGYDPRTEYQAHRNLCECRKDMRFDTNNMECRIFIDVDCSYVTRDGLTNKDNIKEILTGQGVNDGTALFITDEVKQAFCILLDDEAPTSLMPTFSGGLQDSHNGSFIKSVFDALAYPPPSPEVIDVHGEQITDKILINILDTNNDNEVNFDEFLSFYETNLTDLIFKHFDNDADGKICKKEAVDGVQSVNFKLIEELLWLSYHAVDLENNMDISIGDLPRRDRIHLDRNRDGSVTLAEMLGKPLIFFPGPVQVMYKSLDPNKNMIISPTEMTNFIKFLSKFFNVLDVNSDCSVSFDEALSSFHQLGMNKNYQLALEMVARKIIALGRYIALNTIEDEDKDNDSQLNVSEILELINENYWAKFREIIHLVFESVGGHFLGVLAGEPSGRNHPQDSNMALTIWLRTYQGFMTQPTFQELKSDCF